MTEEKNQKNEEQLKDDQLDEVSGGRKPGPPSNTNLF